MRQARGITLVTVLIFVALTAGVYFFIAYGNAYWDNFQVNGILRQAAGCGPVGRSPLVDELADIYYNKISKNY